MLNQHRDRGRRNLSGILHLCRKSVLVFKVSLVLRKQFLCMVRHCQILISLHFGASTDNQLSWAGVSKEKILKTARVSHLLLLGLRQYLMWGKPGHREDCWLGKNIWQPETKLQV